jgi:hypothetical protein
LLTGSGADLGSTGYEMSRLVTRVAEHLASQQRRAATPNDHGAPTA